MVRFQTFRRPLRSFAIAILVCGFIVPSPASAARKDRLDLGYAAVELPGAPATILPADIDGDGRQDLVVAVAYTEWDQLGIEESIEMDDVDGLVEVLTIVPSLMDRRELWIFLADANGGYRPLATPIVLDRSVLALESGPPGLPVVALTDDGLSVLRLIGDGAARRGALMPLLNDRSILAHTATFVPELGIVRDLDADGLEDLLFPTLDGAAIYLSREDGLDSEAAARLRWPTNERNSGSQLVRQYPLPEIRDVNGDRLPDLLLPDEELVWQQIHVLLNEGGGRFATAIGPLGTGDDVQEDRDEGSADGGDEVREELVYFGDVDGDGVAEVVTRQDLADEDVGFRKGMRQAKRPPFHYRFFRTDPHLSPAATPYLQLDTTGYAFDGELPVPGGFQDLDGDGRQDLITLTLDFSLMQAVRILTTHRLSIGLDFHIWCQDADGGFHPVPGLDLSGKFRLDLDNFRIGQLSQFAGDFDADGRADFVQMGRGRDVTIHRGREGCVYPPEPDLLIRLEEEPKDLQLVQIRDLDADGLADLLVIQPQKVSEPGVTPPVRLDLYLSRGGA